MIYTQQRRRALNKALRNLYPEVDFYESDNGVPVMECSILPQGARCITDTNEFIGQIREHCTRQDGVGRRIPDYGKTFPVFIESMELTGEGSRKKERFYRANYVSINECSLQKASEYIAEGKLYAVLPKDTCNP